MDNLIQIKEIMRAYLKYSDEIIGFELADLEDKMLSDDSNSIELLENLVYKRDHCIEYIYSNIESSMFEDLELRSIYQDCITMNLKIEQKLEEMMNSTKKMIDDNFKMMSDQGRDKIALRNYFKSQELDGINNFYLDKRK